MLVTRGGESEVRGLSLATFFAERERWLRSVRVEGREELLFELEMLLRGLERYFNLHNLPLDSSHPVVTRDFREELLDARDAMARTIRLARQLLDPGADQKMVFRHYVETQLADDRARRTLVEDELDQDSPQESLFLLRQGFDALKTIVDHLTKLSACPYNLFSDVGRLLLKDVVLNQYFRPLRPLEFRIEYDRIKSVQILELLAGLEEGDRRLFTIAFLALFRNLHYLAYVDPTSDQGPDRRFRILFALIRSEAVSLIGYLKTALGTSASTEERRTSSLKVARSLARELGRMTKGLTQRKGDAALAQALAPQLAELFRREICSLAAAIDPSLGATPTAELFKRLVSRTEMATRLRLDLWCYAHLCRMVEERLRAPDGTGCDEAVAALHRFIAYFQDVSYQLLRYGDFEPFDRFAAIALEVKRLPAGPMGRVRFAEDCRMFAQVAETAFVAVDRRAELALQPFALSQGQALLARYSP